ncbi:hypothetical protein PsYK624_104410 [Phanerochaete sordida]|uniref:Uncharacterized protein n=1 Tax=Phanerochaete sordida TaxID=48140 RepID=A0A9P3LHL7_9APHY|nr:hypothetical protein PsYK624_104410 [Phanerochaete sordida]
MYGDVGRPTPVVGCSLQNAQRWHCSIRHMPGCGYDDLETFPSVKSWAGVYDKCHGSPSKTATWSTIMLLNK